MNLHHLEVFYAVARTGNFTRAAEKLFISQPAVSVQVRRLEESLGVPLIELRGRQVALTEAGDVLLGYSERIFGLAAEAGRRMSELRDGLRGRVVIGASTTPGTYLLPVLIARFRALHPEIEVIPDIRNTAEVERRLLANEYDLGVVGEDPGLDPDLAVEPFGRDRLVAAVGPDHPLAARGEIKAADLTNFPLILREQGSSTREKFEVQMKSAGHRFQAAMELQNNEAIKNAAAAGLGVAVLSEMAVAGEVQAGRLAAIRVTDLFLEREFRIAYWRRKRHSPAALAFLQTLRREDLRLVQIVGTETKSPPTSS